MRWAVGQARARLLPRFPRLVAAAREPALSTAGVLWQAVVTIPAVEVLIGLALAAVGAHP